MGFFNKHLNSTQIEHYKNTAGMSIVPVTLPDTVYIPMSQSIGKPCSPVVAKGDHVRVGQLIAEGTGFVSAPIHSSVSGEVVDIKECMSQMGVNDTHIVIKTDGRQEPDPDIHPPVITNKQEFLDAVRRSGLVGLGGATFPMSVKFTVRDDLHVDTLIINGAECEPFITVDHMTMLSHTAEIVRGIKNIMKWLDIERAVIGIENNKMDAVKAFESELAGEPGISIHTLRGTYPQGAERVICYETTGRHLIAGKLPADIGVIVSNVTSVLKLEQFIETGMPLVAKSITVDGNAIAKPMNVEAPIGTLISDIIAFCGGEKKPIRKIVLGGPMMGRAIPRDDFGIIKGNSSILCFDESYANINPETACINCGRCVDACPMNLMPTKLAKAFEHKNLDMLREYNVYSCMDCGSCGYNCPARKQLNFEIKMAKALVMADDRKKAEAEKAKQEGGAK